MTPTLPDAVITARAGAPPPEGTDVAPRVTQEWPATGGGYAATGTTVVFVHGYNNPHAEARYKYAVFRGLLRARGVTTDIVEFHWPGDAHLGLLSFASFSAEIGKAIDSGHRLAAWIQGLAANARVVLVSHSLGGRVVLEAINALRATHGIERIVGVCLMAAAVRRDKVADGSLGPGGEASLRWRVLFSQADGVLHYGFPIGQTVGGDGFFPIAVGRFGDPADKWDHTPEASGYAHGHYWFAGPADDKVKDDVTRPLTAPLVDRMPAKPGDRYSVGKVTEFLGFRVDHALAAAAGPATNEIGGHTLATGQIAEHQLGR